MFKIIIITLSLLTIILPSQAGEISCVDELIKFINDSGNVLHRLQPEDWIEVTFQSGKKIVGKFKFVDEGHIFLFDSSRQRITGFKTEAMEKASIVFLMPGD